MSKDTIVNEMRANLAREREGLALVRNTARGAFRVFRNGGRGRPPGPGSWLLGDREALPGHLRRTAESLGAALHQAGPDSSTSSPSLFPEEYVSEFQKCLDRTPPLPFHYIRETVEAELGAPLDTLVNGSIPSRWPAPPSPRCTPPA